MEDVKQKIQRLLEVLDGQIEDAKSITPKKKLDVTKVAKHEKKKIRFDINHFLKKHNVTQGEVAFPGIYLYYYFRNVYVPDIPTRAITRNRFFRMLNTKLSTCRAWVDGTRFRCYLINEPLEMTREDIIKAMLLQDLESPRKRQSKKPKNNQERRKLVRMMKNERKKAKQKLQEIPDQGTNVQGES